MISHKKRGQLTAFILIGLVAAFVLGIGYYAYTKVIAGQFETEADRFANYPASIRASMVYTDMEVKNCMKTALSDGLFTLGAQGGRITVGEPSFKTLNTNEFGEQTITTIGYGYYFGGNQMPDIKDVKAELDAYIESNVADCAQLVAVPLYKEGVTLEFGEIKSDVQFVDDKTLLKVNYKITLIKPDVRQDMPEFKVELPVRFLHVYNKANSLVDNLVEDPEYLDLTAMSNENMDIAYIPYDGNNIIFSINDYGSNITTTIMGEDYVDEAYGFLLANKMDIANATELFQINESFVVNAGERFIYKINAGPNMSFRSEGGLFSISEKGVIDFTPSEGDEGVKQTKIIATDKNGAEESKDVFFLIIVSDKAPVINEIGDQICEVGYYCTISVSSYDLNDDFIIFSDDSNLFDINTTSGIIQFIPDKKGSYKIKITASDGAFDTAKEFNLQINDAEKPKLIASDTLSAFNNTLFAYDFSSNLEEKTLVFYSSNETWFEISPYEGIVEIIPKNVGVFYINVTVQDMLGNSDSKVIRFEVKP